MSAGVPTLPPARMRLTLLRRAATRRPTAALGVGAALLATITAACIFVPIFWGSAPEAITSAPSLPPSLSHPFGTDTLGRDVFVRTLAGGRIDLFVAAFTVLVSALIGSVIGITAAFSGRWVDATLMRIVDAVIAFPFMVLVLAIVLLFGTSSSTGPLPAGLPSVLVAIIITDWAVYARLARGQTLSLRERDFVVAARVMGYSNRRIVLRHLFPNVVSAVGAYMVSDAILVVITTASLPFLGAGIQPPTPEWGAMMVDGSTVLGTAWWITIMPGVVLALTGIGLSLIADALLGSVAGVSR